MPWWCWSNGGKDALCDKAQWDLAHETRHGMGERLPAHPELPGLEPEVAGLFRQVSQQA